MVSQLNAYKSSIAQDSQGYFHVTSKAERERIAGKKKTEMDQVVLPIQKRRNEHSASMITDEFNKHKLAIVNQTGLQTMIDLS